MKIFFLTAEAHSIAKGVMPRARLRQRTASACAVGVACLRHRQAIANAEAKQVTATLLAKARLTPTLQEERKGDREKL